MQNANSVPLKDSLNQKWTFEYVKIDDIGIEEVAIIRTRELKVRKHRRFISHQPFYGRNGTRTRGSTMCGMLNFPESIVVCKRSTLYYILYICKP